MGLFGFGNKTPPNPYTREDMQRDFAPSRINSEVYQGKYGGPITPLRCAIYYGGDASIVGELIRNGADIHAKESDGYPSLVGNLIGGDLPIIKEVVKHGFDVNTSGRSGTLLHLLADSDKVDAIKFLINSGADVNSKKGISARTPVQEAAACGNSKVLQLLIDAGGKINVDSNDESPLFEAILGNSAGVALAFGAGNPRVENVRVLLNAGAIVNKRILDLANRIGNKEVIKMLSDAGAS